LTTIIEIRQEAARWLETKGIEQWPVGLFNQMADYLAERIAAGEEYIVFLGESVVGTLRLQRSDPRMWPESGDDAGYVHGLAVRRERAGRGIGLEMLRWAEGQVVDAGKSLLRLDCVAHNARLVRYYEEAGFARAGQVETKWDGGTLHQRFEKRVSASP